MQFWNPARDPWPYLLRNFHRTTLTVEVKKHSAAHHIVHELEEIFPI